MNSGTASRPRDPHDAPAFTLAVSAVASRLGIAPATLRTWDRRYGLGPAAHTEGRHRRYAPQDVARLHLMVNALHNGAAPAEAADNALRADSETLNALVAGLATDPPLTRAARGDGTKVGPGAAMVLCSEAGEQARRLAESVQSLDAVAVHRQLSGAITEHGVMHTWDTVVRPVLRAIGERWAGTGSGVEFEHVLSDCVAAVLAHTVLGLETRSSSVPVLLAGMPGEQHILPLRALAAVLAVGEVSSVSLGGDTPVPALVNTITAIAPESVFLWAQMDRCADAHLLDRLPPAHYVLGGPAWERVSVPAGVEVVDSLGAAADALSV